MKLRMEKRRGSPTTILYELEGVSDLQGLGRELRQLLHVGGTTKGGNIELQGEHRDRLRVYLNEKGFTVKG